MRKTALVVTASVSISFLTGFGFLDAAKSTFKNAVDSIKTTFGGGVDYILPPSTDVIKGKRSVTFIAADQHSVTGSNAFKAYLQDIKIDNRPYYVETDQTSADLRLSTQVTRQDADSRNFVEERMQCPGTKVVRTCSNSEARYYKVGCTERYVNLEVRLVLTDNKSNQVITDRVESDRAIHKVCSDSNNKDLLSIETLFSRSVETIGNKVFGDMVPTVKKRPSKLLVKADQVSGSDEQLLKGTKDLVESGNIGQALRQYNDLLQRYPHAADIKYNIALVHHASGKYQQAYEILNAIQSDIPHKQRDVQEALLEIKSFLARGYTEI